MITCVGKVRGKDVAVKVPLKQRLTKDELQAFKQEVEIMRYLCRSLVYV
jgi:hypothetical protein